MSDTPWIDPLKNTEESPPLHLAEEPHQPTEEHAPVYFPLLETLRLYAGWLLAWYCLVYAVGSYQFLNDLPYRIPYAESLFLSPLVLSFTFAAYLFLLLSGIYRSTGRKRLVGFILFIAGVFLFLVYKVNVE